MPRAKAPTNTSPKQRPEVALLIETSNAYARGLLRGVRSYVREHGPWSFYLGEQSRGEPAPSWLGKWRGSGIIARIETAEIARAVNRTRLPAVDVSAAQHVPSLPFVETDDGAVAQLAAEHLLERGFRQVAFCGDDRFQWSRHRCNAFVRLAAARGVAANVFAPSKSRAKEDAWETERRQLASWLHSLPKPVGIMAAYDIRGRQILDICRDEAIDVPDQVAVIGVDNDELLCDLAWRPLSSVVPDTHRTGYLAAELLARMMASERVAPGAHLLRPLGVVTRASTDALAIDDPVVSAAVRYIRDHACEGITVNDVLRVVPWSRRVLESRFAQLIGRTPHDEILRVRMDRVKRFLIETDLPLAAIADRTGFRHVEYLTVAFKRETGALPTEYRRNDKR